MHRKNTRTRLLQLLSIFLWSTDAKHAVPSLPASYWIYDPPTSAQTQSLFTGTICPINVRSQQTFPPLTSPLDLNKGRSLTNCCLETQQDASIMGLVQKTARPSSDLSCAASERRLQIIHSIEAICFCVSVLLSKTFISQGSLFFSTL